MQHPAEHHTRVLVGAVEAAMWKRWRDHADEEARQNLLDMHLPYARVVAASYYGKRLHDEIEFDDYLQLASMGLLEALDRFEADRGFQFRTFAARRMHGAILDGIGKLTEKQQQIAARRRLLGQRQAATQGVLESLDTRSRTPEQVLQFVAEVGFGFALAWILDGTGMLNSGEASETLPFYRSLELKQLRQRIDEIVHSLPAQERKVIQSHYFQELPFEKIAQMLHLSKGRISQIHRKAIEHLKEALRSRQNCDISW